MFTGRYRYGLLKAFSFITVVNWCTTTGGRKCSLKWVTAGIRTVNLWSWGTTAQPTVPHRMSCFKASFLFARSGRQILTEIICFVFATQVHISSTKPFKIKHLCKLVYEGESGSVKEGWALENAIEMKFFVLIFAIVCLLQVCLIGCRLALCFK